MVEPCFATFFLAKLLGKHNFYYDLQSLDPVAGLRKEHPGRSPKCLDERMDFEIFWDSLVVFGVYIYTVYISIYPYIYIYYSTEEFDLDIFWMIVDDIVSILMDLDMNVMQRVTHDM